MDRKAFLDQEPPPGYIAGIGRGATGFTTSADTGSIRIEPGAVALDNDEDTNDIEVEDDNDNGLLSAKLNKDQDDEEADRIYAEIDRRMKLKNKGRPAESETSIEPTSTTKEQFADLKRALSGVSNEQWETLPEVGDLTRRNKRARLLEQQQQRYYAMPDSVIAGAGSFGSGANGKGDVTNFQSISGARDKLLGKQLDSLVSPNEASNKDELNDELISAELESQNNVGDIKKGRLILLSLRNTNPYKANSWIASARLEDQAKNYTAAKNFIVEGCRKVPHNEDVWLESIQIHQKSASGTKLCKAIVTEALKFNGTSEKLWIKAFELENSADIMSRRRILMKSLESIPHSVTIWKRLIDLEDDLQDVSKMLQKAIELCPTEWSFWTALINLSNYEDSKSLLNKARKTMKSNHQVWITAAKLEEREHEDISVQKLSSLIEKGMKKLESSVENTDNLLSRREWLSEAADTEKEGFKKTCQAIVNNALNIDSPYEPEAKLNVWFQEAGHFTKLGNFETSNCIYQYIIEQFPNNLECWVRLLTSLKQISNLNLDRLFNYYKQAIELNPEYELFHLMYAKDKWMLAKDVDSAREILMRANETLPENEAIWLARMKLEYKTLHFDTSIKLSTQVIETIPDSSPRVWYKHIHLTRFLNKSKKDIKYETSVMLLCNDALERFPDCEKLYLQKGQILQHDLNKIQSAREVYSIGVKKCPKSINLWLSLVHIDESELKILIRARSTLDMAILSIPNSEELWSQKIEIERRNGDKIAAKQLCNKALQEFPNSPVLWVQHLRLIPKMSHRKNAFLDALKQTDNSLLVLLNIGIFFWIDGKFMKAKSWFERALKGDKDNGDYWGWLFNFIEKHGTNTEKQSLIENFEKQFESINRGKIWVSVVKDVENFDKSPTELLTLVSKQLITTSTI